MAMGSALLAIIAHTRSAHDKTTRRARERERAAPRASHALAVNELRHGASRADYRRPPVVARLIHSLMGGVTAYRMAARQAVTVHAHHLDRTHGAHDFEGRKGPAHGLEPIHPTARLVGPLVLFFLLFAKLAGVHSFFLSYGSIFFFWGDSRT